MLVSLSLLNSFFSSPLSLKSILNACDRIGIETEVQLPTSTFSSVITAKILTTTPHPNADKLHIATLFDGECERQVVCGAANCRPDIIVPLALPGARLQDNKGSTYTIKVSKLRGIESHGMCCGADELGFPHLQNENGLLEFPSHTPLGEDVNTLLSHTLIECSLTPNLGHCASILGLAREIAHITNTTCIIPTEFSFLPMPTQPQDPGLHDEQVSPFFCRVKISNVSSQPSPQELQTLLKEHKYKPSSAIVDITNYIMLSLGQPLHVYDARSLEYDSIRVECTSSPETLTLLNHEQVDLPTGTPVVRDREQSLAIAGIMGCVSSSFTSTTTEIVLESAYFSPKRLRASQTHIPIHSEASYRFTRGTDPHAVLPALYAAIHSIQSLFPHAEVSPILTYGAPPKAHTVSLRQETVRRVLGLTLSVEEIRQRLHSLGFTTTQITEDSLTITVPSYRHDIHEEIDLIEEIFRTELPKTTPRKIPPVSTPMYAMKRNIADLLAKAGLQEFFTCDLLDTETAALDIEDVTRISLQGSKHATVLRSSLLPGLLKSTATNLNRQAPYVHAFEIGAVYKKQGTQYQESQNLGIILSGLSECPSWLPQRPPLSFYSIKGWIEKLFHSLHISPRAYTLQESHSPSFHPYQQAEYYAHKHLLGRFGTVHPQLCRKAQLKHPVFFAEIALDTLLRIQNKSVPIYSPYPIYPSSFRDITLTLPKFFPASFLSRKLLHMHSKWLESVSIISIYQNNDSAMPSKNVSLRLVFRDKERTLSNQEIEGEYERLLTMLKQAINDTIGTIDS